MVATASIARGSAIDRRVRIVGRVRFELELVSDRTAVRLPRMVVSFLRGSGRRSAPHSRTSSLLRGMCRTNTGQGECHRARPSSTSASRVAWRCPGARSATPFSSAWHGRAAVIAGLARPAAGRPVCRSIPSRQPLEIHRTSAREESGRGRATRKIVQSARIDARAGTESANGAGYGAPKRPVRGGARARRAFGFAALTPPDRACEPPEALYGNPPERPAGTALLAQSPALGPGRPTTKRQTPKDEREGTCRPT